MKKRLVAAFLIVGAISATMVLGASAFWTTTTGSAHVTATAGTADLTIDGCALSSGGCNTDVSLENIYPGWFETTSGVSVVNSGNVPLQLLIELDGTAGALEGALSLSVTCNGVTHNGPLADWENGASFGTLAAGASTTCSATLSFVDNGSNQNNLQGRTADFTVKIYGTQS